MQYLEGTANYGIVYSKNGTQQCVGYCDADWAGDLVDRKSTSGYIFKVGEGTITWSSKKQPCIALSTAEAEYFALASAAQKAVWLRQLMSEFGNAPTGPTTLVEDKQSAIAMTKNPHSHG